MALHFVFLPGLDGTGFLFEPIVRIWPKEYPPPLVLAYPGDRFLNYDQLETFIRPRLPTADPFILIAESFGGPLATRITAQQPPMLCGLVLSATFMRQPRGWLGDIGKGLIGPYIFRGKWLGQIGKWLMKAQGLADWQVQLMSRALDTHRPEVLAARLREAIDVDAVMDLKECRVPVLCLYAKRDLLLAKRTAELIGEANPRVKRVGFDTPHFLMQDEPVEALQEILSFARSLERPA
jgi:pimeloyl-[acyl-carrier protein] methyl ester esterase